jgi:chemotaxis regulatin CheY-phosphate phosphatase CheZ
VSKKVIKTVIEDSGSKNLPDLAGRVIYTPTPRQRQVKAKFWVQFVPGPFADPDNLSMAEVIRVTGTSSLKEWWPEAGFKEWFMNREEAREKLEYLFMKALNTAEDILDDPNAQANAKVQMIKVIGELANKFPNKQQERFVDEDINKMDEKQLKHYLEQRGVSVKQDTEQVIDVQPEKE